MFNKYGYSAYLENDPFPNDLRRNRCLALTAEVAKAKGGFLSTKMIISLFDCNGVLISTSKIGKSREKEHKISYNLALRNAFETFQFNSYKYVPNAAIVGMSSEESNFNETSTPTKEAQDEIERLKQEVAALKEEKEVKSTAIIPVAEEKQKDKKIETSKELNENLKLFYAQPIEKGFQVVDSTPKVVIILLETPKENTFIVKDQNAIVYEEDGFWYISKNDGKSTSLETLNIKF